jgi:hypothetical protein
MAPGPMRPGRRTAPPSAIVRRCGIVLPSAIVPSSGIALASAIAPSRRLSPYGSAWIRARGKVPGGRLLVPGPRRPPGRAASGVRRSAGAGKSLV